MIAVVVAFDFAYPLPAGGVGHRIALEGVAIGGEGEFVHVHRVHFGGAAGFGIDGRNEGGGGVVGVGGECRALDGLYCRVDAAGGGCDEGTSGGRQEALVAKDGRGDGGERCRIQAAWIVTYDRFVTATAASVVIDGMCVGVRRGVAR